MEQAALHRMAKSIAQLTLCQVTGEEIETATKLLEKACQKLRGIPEVPPQRITDLFFWPEPVAFRRVYGT